MRSLQTLNFQRKRGLGLWKLCRWNSKPEMLLLGIYHHPLVLDSCKLSTHESLRHHPSQQIQKQQHKADLEWLCFPYLQTGKKG